MLHYHFYKRYKEWLLTVWKSQTITVVGVTAHMGLPRTSRHCKATTHVYGSHRSESTPALCAARRLRERPCPRAMPLCLASLHTFTQVILTEKRQLTNDVLFNFFFFFFYPCRSLITPECSHTPRCNILR